MLTLTKSSSMESNCDPPHDICVSGLTHTRWMGLGILPNMALYRLSSPVVFEIDHNHEQSSFLHLEQTLANYSPSPTPPHMYPTGHFLPVPIFVKRQRKREAGERGRKEEKGVRLQRSCVVLDTISKR